MLLQLLVLISVLVVALCRRTPLLEGFTTSPQDDSVITSTSNGDLSTTKVSNVLASVNQHVREVSTHPGIRFNTMQLNEHGGTLRVCDRNNRYVFKDMSMRALRLGNQVLNQQVVADLRNEVAQLRTDLNNLIQNGGPFDSKVCIGSTCLQKEHMQVLQGKRRFLFESQNNKWERNGRNRRNRANRPGLVECFSNWGSERSGRCSASDVVNQDRTQNASYMLYPLSDSAHEAATTRAATADLDPYVVS